MNNCMISERAAEKRKATTKARVIYWASGANGEQQTTTRNQPFQPGFIGYPVRCAFVVARDQFHLAPDSDHVGKHQHQQRDPFHDENFD